MRLIKPSTEILHFTPAMDYFIETIGRVCYKSESKITSDSSKQFIRSIISNNHSSVLEHASITVRFIVDRGVSHEIVRHRIASFSQESTRYCNYEKKGVTFIIPSWCDIEPGLYEDEMLALNTKPEAEWVSAMLNAEESYLEMLSDGWRPEQARSVLPNSLKTEIVMTANIREWRHFMKLRTSPAAHPQMREVAIPLLQKFKDINFVLFGDIS